MDGSPSFNNCVQICLIGTCPDQDIENGSFETDMDILPNNTYAVGTKANLTCDEGFHVSEFLTNDRVLQMVSCEENGVWVPPLRKCISDDNGKFSITSFYDSISLCNKLVSSFYDTATMSEWL